jgi:hypothetical protein
MKDALDTVKYILRKLLLDNEHRYEQIIQPQECSWKKILTSNSYSTFKQHIGEKLLNISRTVIIFIKNSEEEKKMNYFYNLD